jgi:uncharacterized damage-inducible protein DinB
MTAKSFQTYMLDEIPEWIEYLIEDLSTEDIKFRKNKHSSIGWTIGHLVGTQHFFTHRYFKGDENYKLNELETFNSKTTGDYTGEPTIKWLLNLYKEDLAILKELVEKLSDSLSGLDRPIPHPELVLESMREIPMAKYLSFIIAHQLMHIGQALETRRMINNKVWPI